MARKPTLRKTPLPRSAAAKPLSVVEPLVQTPAQEPSAEKRDPHPHAALDRAAMASLARFTGCRHMR